MLNQLIHIFDTCTNNRKSVKRSLLYQSCFYFLHLLIYLSAHWSLLQPTGTPCSVQAVAGAQAAPGAEHRLRARAPGAAVSASLVVAQGLLLQATWDLSSPNMDQTTSPDWKAHS